MKTTISAFRADLGGIGGHLQPSPQVCNAVSDCVRSELQSLLTDAVDVFDHPFWNHAAHQIAEKTLSIRRQGFFGNAMLSFDELSQSDIINIIRELDDHFVMRKPKTS